MSSRWRQIISILACGLILAYLSIASSNVFVHFAPLPVNEAVLYAVAVLFGLYMGVLLEEFSTIFYSIGLMTLVAGGVFGAMMARATLINTPLVDIALLFAFQQTLPRLIFIAVLASIGVFFAGLQRMISGKL
jgi:hypothetical protein